MSIDDIKHATALVKVLSDSTEPLPIDLIEERLQLSRRSLYYTIKRLNSALNDKGLDGITNLRGAGYILPDDTKEALATRAQQARPAKSFQQLFHQHFYFPHLRQDDRQLLMVFALISRRYTSLNQLAKCFGVSKNTIITDLKKIKETSAKDLIITNTRQGKAVKAPEKIQRRWVFSHFDHLAQLINSHITYTPHSLYEQQLQILEEITAKSFTEHALKITKHFYPVDH